MTRTMLPTLRRWVCTALVALVCFSTIARAQVPDRVGEFLDAPLFDQFDENGVDLSTGYLQVGAPGLSAGSADHPLSFSMRWTGRNWTISEIPSIWFDDGTDNWTVRLNGQAYEFDESGDEWREVAPVQGAQLRCSLGEESSNANCGFTSPDGDVVSFLFTGQAGPIAFLDHAFAPFGNFNVQIGAINDRTATRSITPAGFLGNISYRTSVGTGALPSGAMQISWGQANAPTVSVDLERRTASGTESLQGLTIQTPNNRTSDLKDHFLYPENTTQIITDPEGNDWRYTINDDREITRIERPDGSVTQITDYTGEHRVEVLTNDAGTWRYSYSNNSTYRWITRTDPNGNTVRVKVRKRQGYVVEYTDELGRTTYYDHDESDTHYLTRIRYPEGNRLEFDHDHRGNITARRAIPRSGSGDTVITETAQFFNSCSGSAQGEYPRNCNRPQRSADGRGSAIYDTEYRYEDSGTSQPTLIVRPPTPHPAHGTQEKSWRTTNSFTRVNGQTVLATQSTCRRESTCNPTGNLAIHTDIRYVDRNDLILPQYVTTRAGNDSLAATVAYSYDSLGNPIAVNGPLPGPTDTVRTAYNDNRQSIAIISPDPDGSNWRDALATRTVYDAMGRAVLVETGTVETVTDTSLSSFVARNRVATRYDGLGRPVLVASASDSTTHSVVQTSYDVHGRPICIATRMNGTAYPRVSSNGAITGGSLPANACSVGSQGSHGPDRITRNSYDAAGQLTRIERGVGTSDRIIYARYSYDRNGNRIAVTDANGNRTQFTYDGHDRLERWTFPSQTTTGAINAADYEEYGYDANGNRTSLRRRDGRIIRYRYDHLNRMTLKDMPGGSSADVHYGYERQGQLLRARFGSATGDGVTHVYDQLGRMRSSTLDMDGIARTLRHSYDLAGNRTRLYYPDNARFDMIYNVLDQLRKIQRSGLTLAAFQYDDHTRLYRQWGGATTSLAYDPVGRLSSLGHDFTGASDDLTYGFTYNPASQITRRTASNDNFAYTHDVTANTNYAANGLNQYATIGANSLRYDANGNLTRSPSPRGTVTYTYDDENRLIRAVSPLRTISLRYDPLGRLYEISGGADGTVRLLHDGDALVAEYRPSGVMLRRFVHGQGVDNPIAWFEGSSAAPVDARYFRTDQLGSVVAISGRGNNFTHANSYDEWGLPAWTEASGTLNMGRFGFTGQAWFGDLGLYYYKARFYSPSLGRFLQTDPIGYDDNLNLYAYVGGDPINATDPTGMFFEDPAFRNARRRGMNRAWAQERALIMNGERGTVRWNSSQQEELIRRTRVSGYEAHHRNTVNGNSLSMAENPDNISFVPKDEHQRIHREAGGTRQPIRNVALLNRSQRAAALPSLPTARGLGALNMLTIFSGIASGRIRTDSTDNFFSDMTGFPSVTDMNEHRRRECLAVGFSADSIRPGSLCI